MTPKPEHIDAFDDDFFDQFLEEKRETMKKIWESSRKARRDKPDVSEQEVDEAIENINRRIDANETSQKKSTKNKSTSNRAWRWPMAAAIIIIITVGAWLLIPRTVSVPNGQVAQVMLPDGSTVTLNSGSSLKYSELYSYTNRELELNGEAFFSVQHGDHPFLIHANKSDIKVTGTKFNVRSWADDPDAATEVSVVEGIVRFYRKNSEQIVKIKPGETSRITSGLEQPTPPDSVDLGRVLGWRNNKLIFNNRSLAVIFNELERRFDTKIKVEDSEINREKLSAFYSNPSDAESVLKDICRVKGLHYAKTANGFRVFTEN